MTTEEKKPTPESRLGATTIGFGAEGVNRDDSTEHLLWQAFSVRPKLNRAALDVLIAIHQLGPTAYQEDIWELAEVSDSTGRRALRRLESVLLIVTTQRWNGGQTKNTYQIIDQSLLTDRSQTDQSKVTDHEASQKRLPHDVMHDVEMSKKLDLLNFIDWSERLKRAGQRHCTLNYAQEWRRWWDRRDFPEWMDRPAGFANSEMKKGHPPPPPQMNLPATAADLTHPTGHTYTPEDLELINSNPPQEGMRFNPSTGAWS